MFGFLSIITRRKIGISIIISKDIKKNMKIKNMEIGHEISLIGIVWTKDLKYLVKVVVN